MTRRQRAAPAAATGGIGKAPHRLYVRDFSDDVRLEIIPISSGYEGWQMMIRSVQSSSPGVAGKSHLGRRKLMPNNVL